MNNMIDLKELIINYEDDELHIEDYHFHSCTYINIKSLKDIMNAIEDFIKTYCIGDE